MGSLFIRSHTDRVRDKGYKLHRRFCLDIRKKYIYFYSEISHWNNLPREVVESPSPEVFKKCLGRLLDDISWAPLCTKPDGFLSSLLTWAV